MTSLETQKTHRRRRHHRRVVEHPARLPRDRRAHTRGRRSTRSSHRRKTNSADGRRSRHSMRSNPSRSRSPWHWDRTMRGQDRQTTARDSRPPSPSRHPVRLQPARTQPAVSASCHGHEQHTPRQRQRRRRGPFQRFSSKAFHATEQAGETGGRIDAGRKADPNTVQPGRGRSIGQLVYQARQDGSFRDSARDMAEQYNDNPKTLKHHRTHIFLASGSTTLRSTAWQTCQCPRRFSRACATNPAWAHKTYLDLSCRRVAAGGARKETTLQWPAVLAANTHADNQRGCRSSNLRGHE